MNAPQSALVTVLITARNRPDELRVTLRALQKQDYEPLELIVIDDHSECPLEETVKREWRTARVVRNATNIGYIASRSLGMRLASGDYIVSLDDDSCLTDPTDLWRAVLRMEQDPKIGVLAFLVYNGSQLAKDFGSVSQERKIHTFTGCGHMIRAEVVNKIGDYRDFYHYYGEENEYALRIISNGWVILYFPSVVVHHRVSTINRKQERLWAYTLRNNIWTSILHFPGRQLPIELFWKSCVGFLDAVRLLRLHWLCWAFASAVVGLPRIFRLRKPISHETAALYDALRFSGTSTSEESLTVTWKRRWRWFFRTWLNRRRARTFWDRRPGGVGEQGLALYATRAADDRAEE